MGTKSKWYSKKFNPQAQFLSLPTNFSGGPIYDDQSHIERVNNIIKSCMIKCGPLSDTLSRKRRWWKEKKVHLIQEKVQVMPETESGDTLSGGWEIRNITSLQPWIHKSYHIHRYYIPAWCKNQPEVIAICDLPKYPKLSHKTLKAKQQLKDQKARKNAIRNLILLSDSANHIGSSAFIWEWQIHRNLNLRRLTKW